jgi:pimeloyl-ACP methyl ester carboxylesterase/DNA-binding CsgD family transcriptional regulator
MVPPYDWAVRQEVRFATSRDGTRIAWAQHGHGPPLVRAATWLTNLESDWTSPIWKHWLTDLGQSFTVVRYDDRGSGLSDRHPVEISFERWVEDLEAVAEGAGFERFALLGMSQAGAVAIAYAARHPARIESLILYGAYSKGARRRSLSPEALEENDLFLQLMRVGWGRANPAFGRIFTAELIPNASDEQARGLDTLQRSSTDGETAARMAAARSEIDVTELAKSIAVPTLILHARDDEAVAFEEGRLLASLIPGARMVVLEGRNHILLDDEPAWTQFIQELASFAGARRPLPAVEAIADKLSRREVEVLQIASQGKSNEEIATELGLSVRTIERHLGNIYMKLELSGKSARAGAVARLTRHNA